MATDSTRNKSTAHTPEADESVDATAGASKAGTASKAAHQGPEESKDAAEAEKASLRKSDADAEDAADSASEDDAETAGDVSEEDAEAEAEADAGAATSGGGFAAGSAAVVSAGLGLASLVGTSLSDMLRSRKELIGQIEGSTGTAEQQIDAFYSTPWHTTAAVNGLFALLAIAVGGVLLAVYGQRTDSRSWVKAVALGGVLLGLVGLLVATGMYFDLFAGAPEVPAAPPAS